MDTVIRKAKLMFAKPAHSEIYSVGFQKSMATGKVALKPLPNVLSIGNTEVPEVRLLVARLALRMKNFTDGYLVYSDDGFVKYYAEPYSFTAIHLATFTNFPVYCVMGSNSENA